MADNEQAKRLLRLMSEIDDRYIEEALMEEKVPRKAFVTSLRRHSGMIGAIAAAAIGLVMGGFLFNMMSASSPKTASDEPEIHEISINDRMRLYSAASAETAARGELSADMDYAVAPDATTADCYTVDGIIEDPESIEADGIESVFGFDISVPESVMDSTSREFSISGSDEIIEVRYLDQDGNVICTVRKAPGDGNISDVRECYSVNVRVQVDDIGAVNLSGNASGYVLATWSDGGFSYSVFTSDYIDEQSMIGLVSQVS